MKREKLDEALQYISDRHVAEAAEYRRATPKPAWFAAAAAMLAAVILISVLIAPTANPPTADEPAADVPADTIPSADSSLQDSPAADAPAADAPVDTVPIQDSLFGDIELVHKGFDAAPTYPQMLKFDGYDWGLYFQGRNQQYTQPKGYASGTESFFSNAITQLLSSETDNQVFSPVNIYMALALLAETTGGESQQQILTLLNAESIDVLRTQANHVWNAHFCDDGLSTTLLGNSLWLSDTYTYDRNCIDALSQQYYTAVHQGDLGSVETNNLLHQWINAHTGNLLQEQAEQFNLSPSTVLALVSTVYYKTSWISPFSPEGNQELIFHAPAGDVSTVFMYQQLSRSTYYQGKHFAAVPMKLKDDGRMWLVLPQENITPADLLAEGSVLDLIFGEERVWENQTQALIHLTMPKFDVSYSTDLITSLQTMGVTDVFFPERADFTSLLGGGRHSVYVDQATHAARVMVDEEGVTGAAFTAMDAPAAEEPTLMNEIVFTLDRPFLFIIESKDGLPLFAGIVNNP